MMGMRAIDADELLKGQFIHVCNERKHPATVFASDIDLAPTLGSVIVWTPVEKGLPPEEKETQRKTYLYTNRGGGVGACVRGHIIANSEPGGYIVAWANLPAPYKEVTP